MSNEQLKPSPKEEGKGIKQIEWILDRCEKKLIEPANIEFPEAFKTIFMEAMKYPNIIPFMYSNHYDLANGLAMAAMSKILTGFANKVRAPNRPFERFLMPVARSLSNGNQGSFMQEIIGRAGADLFLTKYNLSTAECTTKNDRIKRNTNGDNKIFMLHVARIARDDNGGIALFPEASVEGGRRIKEGQYRGQRKGLQEFESNITEIIELIMGRFGKEILYIPLGLFGPNLLHADRRLPTITALQTLASKNPKAVINIRVGMPMTHVPMIRKIAELNKGKSVTKEDIVKHLRGMAACLLPPDFLPPQDHGQ